MTDKLLIFYLIMVFLFKNDNYIEVYILGFFVILFFGSLGDFLLRRIHEKK